MKLVRLAGWMVMVVMLSNTLYYPMNIALAEPARAAELSGAIKPVSINKATAEELEAVRGIGPAMAQRIVDYREANGGFKSLDQLKEVRVIGDLKYEKLKDQITV